MFTEFYHKYRKWKQRDFLRWRDYVSDYETDFFLPELKGRCEELLKYFEMIDDYSLNHVDDKVFGETLRNLMVKKELERLVPDKMKPPPSEEIAKAFFSQMREMNQREFIQPLKKVIADFNKPLDMKIFGSILNQVNHVCSTVVQVREKLFLYRLSGFATAHEIESGKMVLSEPKDYKVMLVPFQNIMDNIYGVANSTSQTIHQWHKEQMEWKTSFLGVLSERLAQRNNLLTIIAAIAISWLFLAITNPYEKLVRERDLSKLGDKVIELENQRTLAKQQLAIQAQEIQDQAKKIIDLTVTLKNATPTSPQSKQPVPTSPAGGKK